MSEFDYDTFIISLNETNLDLSDARKSTFTYNFPGTVKFEKSKIALSKLNIYYSWFNISDTFDNTTFQYVFTDGSGSSTHTVTMPEGYYTVSNINTFLQQTMIDNGHYLVDGDGNYVYYLDIVENSTYYAVQINSYPFPTALPSGWTNPNSLTFPATASTAQWIILANGFSTLIGISPGTYPSVIGTAIVSTLSDFTPTLDPIQSLIMTVNLVKNVFANPQSQLFSFGTNGVSFGDLIESNPSSLLYATVSPGYYSQIQIQFLDQLYRPVTLQDPDVLVQLSFIVKNE